MLNRDKISLAIDTYCKDTYTNYTIAEKEINLGIRYTISHDGGNLVLDTYHNKKGGTTLAVNSGKPTLLEDRKKLAQYILESPLCAMATGSDHNRSMLFKDITREDFDTIIAAICEEDDFKALISKEESKEYTAIGDPRQELVRYLQFGGFPALHLQEYPRDAAYTIVHDIYNSTIFTDTGISRSLDPRPFISSTKRSSTHLILRMTMNTLSLWIISIGAS